MKRIIEFTAQLLSGIFYPLLMPTIGMALFCYSYSTQVIPLSVAWMVVAIVCTLLLTCILPLTAILIMVRKGAVSNIYITDHKQRTIPYLYSAVGFAFWSYLLIFTLKAPLCINVIAIGATIAIIAVMLINRSWKISAHLTGAGGLLGGLFGYCLSINGIPTGGTILLWLALTLMLMYARLYLKAHTPTQVVAGWLLGLCCTLIPNIIIYYAIV